MAINLKKNILVQNVRSKSFRFDDYDFALREIGVIDMKEILNVTKNFDIGVSCRT